MKNKTTNLFYLSFAILLLTLSCVSASSFSTSTNSISLSPSVNSSSFTLNPTNASNQISVSLIAPVITANDGSVIPFTLNPGSLNNFNTSQSISIMTTADYTKLYLGTVYSGNLVVYNTANSSDTSNITVNLQKSYCKSGEGTNSTRYLELVNVKDTSSSTQWKWKPGDDVSIDVKVRYNNDVDSSDSIDAVIKLQLYDTQTNKFVEFDNNDASEQTVSLDQGSSFTQTFKLTVPVSDIADSSSRYRLYVKVYEDGKESKMCEDRIGGSDTYQEIEINKQSHEVILKSLNTNTPVPCGQEAVITATAWNIGNNDEKKVYVKMVNSELGINQNSDTFQLDQGNSAKVAFNFMVPTNVTEKTYDLNFVVYYKYSSSSDSYGESSSDTIQASLKVENCVKTTSTASITAQLSSDTPKAIVGQQVVVQATIKNTGTTTVTHTIDVVGNTQWSSLASIDPKTITLAPGESKQVNIYLDIASNAGTGDKDFTIRTTYNGVVTEQKVVITLESGFSSQALIDHFKANGLIYLIVLINIILIIAIILVARRVLRKSND